MHLQVMILYYLALSVASTYMTCMISNKTVLIDRFTCMHFVFSHIMVYSVTLFSIIKTA